MRHEFTICLAESNWGRGSMTYTGVIGPVTVHTTRQIFDTFLNVSFLLFLGPPHDSLGLPVVVYGRVHARFQLETSDMPWERAGAVAHARRGCWRNSSKHSGCFRTSGCLTGREAGMQPEPTELSQDHDLLASQHHASRWNRNSITLITLAPPLQPRGSPVTVAAHAEQ